MINLLLGYGLFLMVLLVLGGVNFIGFSSSGVLFFGSSAPHVVSHETLQACVCVCHMFFGAHAI